MQREAGTSTGATERDPLLLGSSWSLGQGYRAIVCLRPPKFSYAHTPWRPQEQEPHHFPCILGGGEVGRQGQGSCSTPPIELWGGSLGRPAGSLHKRGGIPSGNREPFLRDWEPNPQGALLDHSPTTVSLSLAPRGPCGHVLSSTPVMWTCPMGRRSRAQGDPHP